jgi:choline dehydrogenase-like flavoprotein
MDAAVEAGYELTEDYNGFRQEGFGRMDMTVRDGERCSSAKAHLYEAMKRPNLTVIQHALASRILFEGKRAVGIAYERGGKTHEVRAGKEVILRAGRSIRSSCSSFRASARQKTCALGLPVLADRPGVGPTSRTISNSISRWPAPSRSPCSATPICWARRRSAPSGCSTAPALAHRTTLNRAVSSAAARGSVSRHPVPLLPDGHRLRRLVAGERTWLPGPCRLDALQEPGHGHAAQPDPRDIR